MSATKFENFNYWFLYQSANAYKVVSKNSGREVGILHKQNDAHFYLESSDCDAAQNNIIDTEFALFQTRLEYLVGRKADIDGVSAAVAKDGYEALIQGALMLRAYRNGKNPDEYSTHVYIQNVLNWIRSTDFYEAPASTRYHESFKHGLLYHTLKVYNNIIELKDMSKFQNVDIDSATICALAHDWCKCGLYEMYKRNVKNEETKRWEQVDSYRVKGIEHPFGHGVTSMFVAMRMFKLTEEEALAIRWHQGRWHVEDSYLNDFQQANETYPLVHLLQFADQLAITKY